jgi:hypothetical protein
MKTGLRRLTKSTSNKKSVIHFSNIYKILFYVYFANYEYFNFWRQWGAKGTNMNQVLCISEKGGGGYWVAGGGIKQPHPSLTNLVPCLCKTNEARMYTKPT